MKPALQKSPIPKTRAFVVKYLKEPFFDPNWHFHSEYQLFLVLNGSGTRFIGDTIASFKSGDFTFTGPNLPHLWKSDQKSDIKNHNWSEGIVVYFDKNLIGENLLLKEESIKLRQLFKNSLRGVYAEGDTSKAIKKMLLNLVKLEGFEAVLQLLDILNCLSKSEETKLLASPGYTNTLKIGDTMRMNTVYAYAMRHFKNKISVQRLAELTNMTPTSFSRYFKTHANKTFSEFISEIRIGHACKLLIEKKMNITDAAYKSGFQTLSNFNKQFKKITKKNPRDYKKAYLVK